MARPSRPSARRRTVAVLAAAATGCAGLAAQLGPGLGSASSHREAPYTSTDPRADHTDVYAFTSPDRPDTVTLLANWWAFEEPTGGPNFYRFDDDARYDLHVDSNGDAQPDLTYRWTFDSGYRNDDTFLYNTGVVTSFDDPDLNFRQTYDLQVVTAAGATTLLDDAPVAPSNVGPASMPDYAALRGEAVRPFTPGGGGTAFAGQADDPFFLDLRVFDLLYGGDLSEVGVDTLDGYNVQSLGIQVPKSALALNGDAARNPVIGVWSTTSRQAVRTLPATGSGGGSTFSGDFVQVSRLGQPLVNEVVIPVQDKDRFNVVPPAEDSQFLPYVQTPIVPQLVEAIYDIEAPDSDATTEGTQREDLVEVFLTGVCNVEGCPRGVDALDVDLNSQLLNQDVTAGQFRAAEMIRLNMGVAPAAQPNRLGVLGGDLAGFPNGRRLVDDVVDIELQALEGELLGRPNDLGDAVNGNDVPFAATFPYVAIPHNAAVNRS